MVTRGCFYHTISGVAAQAPIREFSRLAVGCLDARLRACRRSKVPEVVLRGEGRQRGAGEVRRAIEGGQRVRPSLVSTVPL